MKKTQSNLNFVRMVTGYVVEFKVTGTVYCKVVNHIDAAGEPTPFGINVVCVILIAVGWAHNRFVSQVRHCKYHVVNHKAQLNSPSRLPGDGKSISWLNKTRLRICQRCLFRPLDHYLLLSNS